MQHKINPDDHGPRGNDMTEAIQACVHCGFCLSACPTYQVLGEEMDSPRGRIYLMKSVMEGELESETAQPYIDKCLGCMACVPACPSGVEYGSLLMGYRANYTPPRTFMDSLTRTMLRETLPYPRRFRLAFQSGKVGKLVEGALPEKIGAMLGLLPDALPSSAPLPEVYPAQGERRARIALLAGCVQRVLAPEINWATLRVLAANGVETVIPQAQGCCGSILMHIGEDERAAQLARNNLDAFPADVDAIITNAAGCGSGMHEYELLFRGTSEEGRAQAFSEKVQDITTFLDALGLREPKALDEPLTVVYQDACHLLHAQGIQSAPRSLLNQIPNLTVKDIPDGGLCCGSAGTYNMEQPEIAGQLGQRKAQHILEAGADAVVSGNIGCLTQIRTHLQAMGQPLPIYHTVQMLDLAY